MSYKLGIFSWYGYRTSLEKRLKLVKKTGFDSTMIWWGDNKAFDDLMPEEIIKTCKDIGLEIENVHVPFDGCNKLWSPDKIERKNVLGKYKKWIGECGEYDIPVIVMHLSKGFEIREFNEYGLECICELVEHCKDCSVKLALENTEDNDLLLEVFSRVDSENLGLCFDSSHAWLSEKNRNEILKQLGSRIIAVHLSDNDGKEDRHLLKGLGVNDWDSMLELLPADLTNISLEVYPDETIEEELFLRKAFGMAEEIRKNLCIKKS